LKRGREVVVVACVTALFDLGFRVLYITSSPLLQAPVSRKSVNAGIGMPLPTTIPVTGSTKHFVPFV
jgi:hypothetical protein